MLDDVVREGSVPANRPHPKRQHTLHVDTSVGPIYLFDDGTTEEHRDGITYLSYNAAEDELKGDVS